MIIGSAVDSSLRLVHQQTRQREIDAASHRLASGNKFDRVSRDMGAFQFAARLDSEVRVNKAAADSLHNAITYIQTQSDGLRTVDRVLLKMDELAFQASDPTLNAVDRIRYQTEFASLQTHLSYMGGEKFNDESLYDPLASKYASTVPVEGVSDGGWEPQEQIVDIGALSGGIRLWWDSTWQTDRLKVYQGASLLFDTGEHRSRHWLNYPNTTEPTFNGTGDIYQIDFAPGSVQVVQNPDNKGVSLHDKNGFRDIKNNTTPEEWAGFGGDSVLAPMIAKFTTAEDYPKSYPATGDSTQLRFVVNEDAGGFPMERMPGSSTVWTYYAEVTKETLGSKSVLAGADGSMIEIQNIGFASLSELSIDTLAGAYNAHRRIRLEQENIRYQQGVIGAEISQFRSQADVLERKTVIETMASAKITDANIAEETTRLAKNLILQDTSNAILSQARIHAANVYNTLL